MLEVKFITINNVDVWYTTIKGHVGYTSRTNVTKQMLFYQKVSSK